MNNYKKIAMLCAMIFAMISTHVSWADVETIKDIEANILNIKQDRATALMPYVSDNKKLPVLKTELIAYDQMNRFTKVYDYILSKNKESDGTYVLWTGESSFSFILSESREKKSDLEGILEAFFNAEDVHEAMKIIREKNDAIENEINDLIEADKAFIDKVRVEYIDKCIKSQGQKIGEDKNAESNAVNVKNNEPTNYVEDGHGKVETNDTNKLSRKKKSRKPKENKVSPTPAPRGTNQPVSVEINEAGLKSVYNNPEGYQKYFDALNKLTTSSKAKYDQKKAERIEKIKKDFYDILRTKYKNNYLHKRDDASGKSIEKLFSVSSEDNRVLLEREETRGLLAAILRWLGFDRSSESKSGKILRELDINKNK